MLVRSTCHHRAAWNGRQKSWSYLPARSAGCWAGQDPDAEAPQENLCADVEQYHGADAVVAIQRLHDSACQPVPKRGETGIRSQA